MLIGTPIGLVAGYYGGRLDIIMMQTWTCLLAFPSLILGLIVVAMLGPSVTNLIIAIALTAIPPFARIARAPDDRGQGARVHRCGPGARLLRPAADGRAHPAEHPA